MTSSSPIVGLMMQALATAMKAKTGELTDLDRTTLRDTMMHAGSDPDWNDAVLAFEELSRVDAEAAGDRLHAWLLERYPAPLARETGHHPWMDRKDING